MILGGMGPVGNLEGDAAKVFASVYALFSGIVFIAVLGMLLAPFVHRIMHKLHMEEDKKGK
jgi:fumarate reductase subunit D